MQEIGIAKTQRPLQRVAVVALGWILMLVGIGGLFLPVVPGAFLIVAGALMLNPQRTWLSRALEKCRMRFPALESAPLGGSPLGVSVGRGASTVPAILARSSEFE
jgi:hypothetical protein